MTAFALLLTLAAGRWVMLAIETGLNSGTYKLVLVLHILTAIAGFGGVLLNGLYAQQSQRRRGPEGRAVSEANFAVTMVAELFIYAVVATGLLLVWLSDGAWSLTDTWVWMSLLVYAAAAGVSHAVLLPGHRRINQLLAEMERLPVGAPPGPPPQAAEVERLGHRQAVAGMVLQVALVMILALMVWKPA